MFSPISISEKAKQEILTIISNKKIPTDYSLRVGIRGAGCAGVSYLLGFDKPKTQDQQLEIDGIPVLIEKKHMMYLVGLEIDFYEGNDARGFTFVKKD